MPKYEITIWWSEEDQAFLAEIPELPYLMAHGDTYAEALASAEEVMNFWLRIAAEEGIEVPEPRGRLVPA